jgi:ribosomal protein S18 acetylase RimI-like enzyme
LRLTVHDDAAQFMATAEPFLRVAEAENSVIILPVGRMATMPNEDDAGSYFASVTDAARMIGAAFAGTSGSVLITAAPAAAVTLIANDIADRGRSLKSLVGPLRQCEAFVRTWRQRTGQAHVLRFHLRHFELAGDPLVSEAPGALRLPEPSEHALIADWHVAFFDELGLPDDQARARRNLARRIERGFVRLWDDGGAVAFVGFGQGGAGIVRIAPVYTLPRYRGRGYASAMVGELARQLLQAGTRAIFLTTDVANPTSNGIYQRIGFRPVADHFHFDFVASPA